MRSVLVPLIYCKYDCSRTEVDKKEKVKNLFSGSLLLCPIFLLTGDSTQSLTTDYPVPLQNPGLSEEVGELLNPVGTSMTVLVVIDNGWVGLVILLILSLHSYKRRDTKHG